MAGSSFELTFKAMRDKATELEKWNTELTKLTSDLRGHQQRLTKAWDGEANDIFDKAFNSDMVQFDNFARAIREYVQALRAAADEYERMENANKQIASERTYRG